MDRAPNARALALPVCVFAAGMISSFFSFLMNPPLAAALIGFLAIANNPGRTPRETGANLLYAAGLIALWFAGYFGEWIAKGVFAALVLGVDPVIKDIMARADVYGEYAINREIGFLDATKLNIYQHGLKGWIYLTFIASGAVLAAMAAMRRLTAQACVAFAAMLAPLAAIVIWTEANASHSIIHCGFTSRNFVPFIIVPLLATIQTWRNAFKPAADAKLAASV
jgi:hypothetical protein